MADKLTSSQIEPLSLGNGELRHIMDMAESSIVHAEAADKLYGLNALVQTRAAASMIQAKCERELARRQLIEREKTDKVPTEPAKKEG